MKWKFRLKLICQVGAFINHVDMAGGGGGGLPNIHITLLALLRKMVNKGGRGGQKVQISIHMVYEWPQLPNTHLQLTKYL